MLAALSRARSDEDARRCHPAPWLETLRLELREFVPRRFRRLLCRLDSDPRVMKYIGDGKPCSRDAVAQRLKRFIRYPRSIRTSASGALAARHRRVHRLVLA